MDGEVLGEQRSGSSRRVGRRLADAAFRLWLQLEAWRERARQRRDLLELDDRLLKDIGISRADARREGGKPFWKN